MKRMTWIFFLSAILLIGISPSCKKQEEEQAVLPDLVIEDISCMGGNLYITLENRGEGSAVLNGESLASLYLDGVAQEEFLLSEPTTTARGGISKPNGRSSYLLSSEIAAPVRVDVYIDFNEKIKESDEANNQAEGLYIGPCLLPDLRIKDIYLDEDSQVVVTVENIGPGTFPLKAWLEEEQPECFLRVIRNDEEFCTRNIMEFDPDKELEPAEGVAVFPTGLKITEESTVTAIVDCSDMIKEQNKENNVKTVVLK